MSINKHQIDKKRNKSFLNILGKFLVSAIGLVAFLSALLCAICPFINPSTFVWTSFFGLAFWIILIANILVLIILISLKARRTLLIPILALLLSIPGFIKSFSFGETSNENASIKIMTFNISNFRDIKIPRNTPSQVEDKIINIINSCNPDIICLQESGKIDDIKAKSLAKKTNTNYFSIDNKNLILSKFPLENIEFFDDDKFYNFADLQKVIIDDSTCFFLVNCHFNSFKISKEEIEYINDTKNLIKESDIYGKSIISKLKNGFEKRSESTKLLLENIPKDHNPIIICGDFNDTPLSYTYNQMKNNGLKDAFISTSFGIGKTYSGSLPLLRIDYFWHNSLIQPIDYKRIKQTTSDHYPLLMSFNILKQDEL
ncbi:MAG: hypothetical protein E7066_03500 [Lentimicrobiaceae bacterium]|nr:hypothetical protein [Lentimicrobiaceae bacterium]